MIHQIFKAMLSERAWMVVAQSRDAWSARCCLVGDASHRVMVTAACALSFDSLLLDRVCVCLFVCVFG